MDKKMKHFISREKLSKKSKKELDSRQRQTWGLMSPVTRKTKNSKVYDRKKVQKGDFDYPLSEPFCILGSMTTYPIFRPK